MAYGIGAAVVIIGALFKIMHFPGAGPMLMIGMGTEAILFTLSAFEPPHREYHWDVVFPQLNEDGAAGPAPIPVMGTAQAASSKQGNTIDDIAASGKLSESDAQKLNEGIQRLSQAAGQIADLSAAVSASKSYADSMNAASASIKDFANTQSGLKSSSDALLSSYKTVAESMGAVATDAKGYMEEMNKMTQSLTKINTNYEMQVSSVAEQAKLAEETNKNFRTMQEALNSAASETSKFKDEATKLTAQISQLNTVYGNMLNAFNRG